MNLIFQTLSWNNCGSYIGGPHEINFSNPGQLIYVTGENKVTPELGSNDIGKSTFINIFYWCLTGKTLRSARPGSAIEPWENDEESFAALTFIKDDVKHTLLRARRPNALALDDTTVTQDQVTELLGLSEEAIQNTLIIGQFNELFLSKRPEQQSALFAELLNLDVWPKAVDLCSKKIQATETEISKVEGSILRAEGTLSEIVANQKTTQLHLEEFESNKEFKLTNLKSSFLLEKKRLNICGWAVESVERKLQQLPDISQQEGELKTFRQAETIAQGLISKSDTLISGRSRELQEIENSLKQYQNSNNLCPACGQQVDKEHINEMIEGFKIRKHKLLDEIKANSQLLKRRQESLKVAQDQIIKLEESLGGAREQILQLTQHYSSCKLQANQKQHEVEQLQKEIDQTVDSVNPYNAILVDLNSRLSATELDLSRYSKQLTQSNKVLEHLKIWLDGFKQIRLNLIDETLDELEITSNTHATRLGLGDWEIGINTERETKKGDLQHKFTVNIFPPDLDHPVPLETLGGGVSTRLQLALFFGLSEVLLARSGITPNVEWLDEPCRHLSDEGIEDLIECLRERAKAAGRSIYFVDHRMLDRGDFDNVLWIEKTNEGSRICM